MKNVLLKKINFNNPYLKLGGLLIICIILILISNHVFAKDLLAGTDTDIKDTMKGTGKNWLYILDGGAALLLFIERHNPKIFMSILGVGIFLNIVMFFAGG